MINSVWGDSETQFFYELDPNKILSSIDKLGLKTTGRVLTLNSMENRVYEIECYDESESGIKSVVAKFYRPGRWSRDQILDEHQFLKDARDGDLNVITPLYFLNKTLFQDEETGIFFALFPKKGGRIPDEMNERKLEELGRTLGRLHNIGESKVASNRLTINPDSFGLDNLQILKSTNYLPGEFLGPISDFVIKICNLSRPLFENVSNIRIHGDCHRSNVIYRETEGAYLVDFDDMLNGPAVQDVWLLVPGDDDYAKEQRMILLCEYESFRDFDYSTLKLIEPLRALRYIHFAAWMAKRYDDPAFKSAFPYFGTDKYWSELLYDLRLQAEKIEALSNPYNNYM